jgi:pSer/pThr/pTyr-binding forkhead associated (FHA) protein
VGYAFAATLERTPTHAVTDLWHWVVVNGRRIRLLEGENVIGRDPASRVWLDVASVSRRHARIVVSPAAVLLEDLGSKNRTAVGETLVNEQTALRDGDRIFVGPVLLVFRTSRSGMSTETHAHV